MITFLEYMDFINKLISVKYAQINAFIQFEKAWLSFLRNCNCKLSSLLLVFIHKIIVCVLYFVNSKDTITFTQSLLLLDKYIFVQDHVLVYLVYCKTIMIYTQFPQLSASDREMKMIMFCITSLPLPLPLFVEFILINVSAL